MATTMRFGTGRTTIKRGPGKRLVDGKSFHLADEVRYIQRRAARHDGRIVSIGQLVLFATETGDAWLLDPSEQLAARLAHDGDPEPIHIEETDATLAIGWKGHYRIEGVAFIYVDRDSGRVSTTLGYPTHKLIQIE
jgi:hypothetical protein